MLIKDELGFEIDIDENLSDEEWDDVLLQHGKWLMDVAETASDNFFNKYTKCYK